MEKKVKRNVIHKGYNPVKDVKPVEQFGYVDLCSALANNSIPADVSASDESYNKIDNPASILGRPRDVFDAAHLQRTIRDYKAPEASTPKEENPA